MAFRKNSPIDPEEVDLEVTRGGGEKASPTRSRPSTTKSKPAKAHATRAKRDVRTTKGIHKRRNRRISW